VTVHQRVVESIAPHPSRLLQLQQWTTPRAQKIRLSSHLIFREKNTGMDIAQIMQFQSVKRLG